MATPDPHEVDPLSLARAFQAGDEIAFAALYQRYKLAIYRFCCRFLDDRAAAEAATQETFVSAFEHHRERRRAEHFRAYLYTIAKSFCCENTRT